MENDPVGGDPSEPLTYQTWILRVSIHCGGCKKKVKKVLQSIEGVYKIDIDSKQHRVAVMANVDSGTLIKKLIKSGKNAALWSENGGDIVDEKKTEQAENDGNDKENQKGPEGGNTSGDDHTEEKGGAPGVAPQGGGGGKKKKKKKKKKGNTAFANAGGAPPPAGSGFRPPPPPPAGDAGPHADQTNPTSPHQQHIFSYPQFYYAAPEYGMSYSSAPPTASMNSSYYTFPMHSYTYIRPPPSDPILRSDYEFCSVM